MASDHAERSPRQSTSCCPEPAADAAQLVPALDPVLARLHIDELAHGRRYERDAVALQSPLLAGAAVGSEAGGRTPGRTMTWGPRPTAVSDAPAGSEDQLAPQTEPSPKASVRRAVMPAAGAGRRRWRSSRRHPVACGRPNRVAPTTKRLCRWRARRPRRSERVGGNSASSADHVGDEPGDDQQEAADQDQGAVEHLATGRATRRDRDAQAAPGRASLGAQNPGAERPAHDQQQEHREHADRLRDLDRHEQLGEQPDEREEGENHGT